MIIKIFFEAFFSFSKKKRYEARYIILSKIALINGFRLYNKYLQWHKDKEFLDIWKGFSESNNQIHERRFNLYYLAKSIQNISGDTVECGVFKGASSYLILKTNSNKKKHHIFDSFQGLSKPIEKDKPKKKNITQWGKNDLSYPEIQVKKNLLNFSNVFYYKGWIPTRFNEIKKNKFSFIHIDVDLYQPTFESISFFYNKINKGGIILCDDYGFETCPGACKAMDEFFKNKPENIVHLTTGQGYIVKQ
jgi:O-methyltransferase